MRIWRRYALVAVMALGVMLWKINAPPPAAPVITQQEQAAILSAIGEQLAAAHVQPQDMPRRIIATAPAGTRRFRVHVEMVQGEAWFEAWWDGSRWQVKGLNIPEAGQ